MTETVQVGDHDPERRVHNIESMLTERRRSQLIFTRKLEATAIELADVVKKLTEARILFSLAQRNDNYAATVDAGKAVVKYADHVAYLAGGIKIAIENENPQETRR